MEGVLFLVWQLKTLGSPHLILESCVQAPDLSANQAPCQYAPWEAVMHKDWGTASQVAAVGRFVAVPPCFTPDLVAAGIWEMNQQIGDFICLCVFSLLPFR